MLKFLDAYLSGRKTYLGIILLGGLTMAVTEGWLTSVQAETWSTLAKTLLGVGVTHKFSKAFGGK